MNQNLFYPGYFSVSPLIYSLIDTNVPLRLGMFELFEKHVNGDWLSLSDEEIISNARAIESAGLVTSHWEIGGEKLRVVTDLREGRETVTRLLLSSESF